MFDLHSLVFSLITCIVLRQGACEWGGHHQDVLPHKTSKSVAIVGAGSAGLAMLKTLIDLPEELREGWEIVLYEQRRDVGGIWLPDPQPLHPPDLPETPLYPLLHTNTPVPTMTYPHFPFPPGTPLYPSHEYVEQYHQDYASHFDLLSYIKLNHTVLTTSWVGTPLNGRWEVVVQDHSGHETRKSFDHLVVANGHNHYPHIPIFPGQEEWLRSSPDDGWEREILHSVWYREPQRYTNRTVVVVGAGGSGRDAASQLAPVARKVYHSIRDSSGPTSGLVEVKPGISHFTADAVVFSDGSTSGDVDSVILATGYDLRVPFLEDGGEVVVRPESNNSDGYRLTTNLRYLFPLHQHIFSLSKSYPTNALAFIGLPILIANCPSDVAQGIYAAHVIANGSLLGSREELLQQLEDSEENLRSRGYDPFHTGHRMVDGSSSDYQDGLIDYLKERGALPDDADKFVESWRREAAGYQYLKRGWERVEQLGQQREWLRGIRTEEDWADLMRRLNGWQKEWETRNGLVFPDQTTVF